MTVYIARCPFCGGDDIRGSEYEHSYMYTRYSYQCEECGAQMASFTSLEEALEKWNKRVS